MLTLELRSTINEKWEACWPVSQLKPLAFLDLLSYLLFIKIIDEHEVISGRTAKLSRDGSIYSGEEDEFRWNTFKEMDVPAMYEIFTKDNGVLDLVKNYSKSNHKYSLFVQAPLLILPSAVLLANTVSVIKTLEEEDMIIRGQIFEYLLNKVETTSQNGQAYPPDYVVKLIVSVLQPKAEDTIFDPAAGNGSFLVNSFQYITGNYSASKNVKKDFFTQIKGVEADPVQLRICAMNMILHGIDSPSLERSNSFVTAGTSLPGPATLVVTNLIFNKTVNAIRPGAEILKTEMYDEKEIDYLNLVFKNLKGGGRAAVIVPPSILYDYKADIKSVRQEIINNHKLEAVISLPVKTGSFFSGAGILIFSKHGSLITDKTWFSKISEEAVKDVSPDYKEQYNEVLNILRLWKNREQVMAGREEGENFFVPVDQIKHNNYSLSFNDYKKTGIVAEDANNFIQSTGKGPAASKRLIFILISVLAVAVLLAVYFFYFKNANSAAIFLDKALPSKHTSAEVNHSLGADTPSRSINVARANKRSIKDTAVIKEGKYIVIAKAYFYKLPDEHTRERAYIDHWNNVVLNPVKVKDGFIYVVYTNQYKKTFKGWLNKKDLKAF